ncbi:hypothetical protein RB653_006603 [Dictyostelium firmibasis]|uniref:Uncharacterized protein n=1 Tax=Dictyostelium firmibasis TaxID=79012 RepID=A0AAN7TU35_9MYCE
MKRINNNNIPVLKTVINKNIFDLTFTINSLPTHLIRKILSYYYNHCLSMYEYIEKSKSRQFTGYKLRFRWMDLCLVCKFWMEMVMPFLPNTFYFMDSQQKLETYLNLCEYGGTFPRRYLKQTVLRVSKPPASIKKYPFHINSLGIYINRYQIPNQYQQDTIIPEFIYQQILKISPDLKNLKFQTVKTNEKDLYYLLKSINESINQSITPLLSSLNFDYSIFTTSMFYQLCKIIESPQCTITNLSLNNCVLSINSLGEFSDKNDEDGNNVSFLSSFKKNKSITTLKMNENNFFTNSKSSKNRVLMGGTILEFLKLILVDSQRISNFQFNGSEIFLDELNSNLSKFNYLTPMHSSFEKLSLSLLNIDNFLPYLEYFITSNDNSLKELNLSHSRFSNYSNVNNLLVSIKHCQSLLKLNLSSCSFNIVENSNNNFGYIQQPQPQPQQQQQQQQPMIPQPPLNGDDDDDEGDFFDGGNEDINSTNAFNDNFNNNQSLFSRSPVAWERFNFLYGTQSLVSINLSSIRMRDEKEMNSLFESLCSSPQIQQLYLNRCGLTSGCLTQLTNFIRQSNSKLELLHIGSNGLGGGSSSIQILLMAFQLNKSLSDIDLSYNNMTDVEGYHIAKFLKSNVYGDKQQIRHLNLSGSGFKLGSINQLGHSLMTNNSLISLNLSDIEMGMLEITYVFDGLVSHPTISLLNLSNCGSNEMITSLVQTSALRCNVIY